MRSILPVLGLVVAIPAMGCGMIPGMGPKPAQPASASSANYEVPKESHDAVRTQEKAAYAQANAAEDAQEDELEKKVQKALAQSLGQQSSAPGMPPPESSSKTLAALRTGGIKLRVEPVTNGDGQAVGGGTFVQLKDSYTDRVIQLQRKMVEGTASAAEKAEIQKGAKYMMKLNDLKMAVLAVSMAALECNTAVQTHGLSNMLKISGMVRSRKLMNMQFTDDDYAQVKAILVREKRTEAVAAATLGMLAAYQAVVASPKSDPKALDAIADSTLKAFPLKVDVTDDEAKAYVTGLGDNVQSQKAKYEGWMRKAMGDAKYERDYKAGIDRMFDQAAGASSQKSVTEMMADNKSKYEQDKANCLKGQDPPPGSLLSPVTCKNLRAQAGAGGDGSGGAAAAPGGDATGGALSKASSVGNAVSAAANGDVGGALDAAAGLVPGDGPIHSSLEGIAAITRGDPKTALQSAMNLVPGGSVVKEGLGMAAKLVKLFG